MGRYTRPPQRRPRERPCRRATSRRGTRPHRRPSRATARSCPGVDSRAKSRAKRMHVCQGCGLSTRRVPEQPPARRHARGGGRQRRRVPYWRTAHPPTSRRVDPRTRRGSRRPERSLLVNSRKRHTLYLTRFLLPRRCSRGRVRAMSDPWTDAPAPADALARAPGASATRPRRTVCDARWRSSKRSLENSRRRSRRPRPSRMPVS